MTVAHKILALLFFLVSCFALAALNSLIAIQYVAGGFGSMYLHSVVGLFAGFALLVNANTSFPIAFLLAAYQTIQSGNLNDSALNDLNAANIAGYVIGIITVVLVQGTLEFLRTPEPGRRKPVDRP